MKNGLILILPIMEASTNILVVRIKMATIRINKVAHYLITSRHLLSDWSLAILQKNGTVT